MKVYEAIAGACIAESSSPIFALMGDGNMEYLAAVKERNDARIVHVRHENAAVAMADGWGRVSGDVGISSVTSGPGLTQVATSLVVAARHRTSLVVLAGETPDDANFHLQAFGQERFATACEAGYMRIRTAENALDDFRQAFLLARTERRPVVLSMPMDIQQGNNPWGLDYEPSRELMPAPPPVAPSRRDLQELAELLMSSSRPVLLVGRGAATSEGAEAMRGLAGVLGARLATSLRAKGLFDDEPASLGVAGAFSSRTAREAFIDADCVVAFGAGLGYYTTEGGYLFPSATIAQVDTSPQPMRDGQRVAHTYIQGDATAVALQLREIIAAQRGSTGRIRSAGSNSEARRTGFPSGGPAGLHPAGVIDQVDRALPAESTIVVGAGHFWNFAVPTIRGRAPSRQVYTYDFGCIGQALPVAAGVAMHGGPCVVIEGDGSLLMNMQELETFGREGIPVLCVVMNDGAYGAEVHKLRAKGMAADQVDFGRSDFAGVAAAVGVKSVQVTDLDQIGPAVRDFLDNPRPTLLDVHIDPGVIAPTYQRLYFGRDEESDSDS